MIAAALAAAVAFFGAPGAAPSPAATSRGAATSGTAAPVFAAAPRAAATSCASGGASPAAVACHFARELAVAGPRPAASAAEARAHERVADIFSAAQLKVAYDRFTVPGLGRSRNVIGMLPGATDCLKVVMAHTDSDPPAPGADDNASGVGALVALSGLLRPGTCEVWLVATGAEERGHTGLPDHQGALHLAERLERRGRADDVRFALSLDEVGRGTEFWLRSPAAAPRLGVERALLRSARTAGVDVTWVRDDSTGNSDHRELELAGMPGMKLGVPDDPCRHTTCDTPDRLQRGAFRRALAVVAPLLD